MPPRYTQQFKDEAVRMVIDGPRPIKHVASELGIHETTLGSWMSRYRASRSFDDRSEGEPQTGREKQLERENRELREENSFLKKAASFISRYEFIDAEKDGFRIVDMCRQRGAGNGCGR